MNEKTKISPELQMQIDEELSRYESLSKKIESTEGSIRNRLKTYDELLNSYQNALKIIIPKMDFWSQQRRTKAQQVSEKLRQKWTNPEQFLRNNKKLSQEVEIYNAIVNIRLKKVALLNKFRTDKEKMIKEKIESILL